MQYVTNQTWMHHNSRSKSINQLPNFLSAACFVWWVGDNFKKASKQKDRNWLSTADNMK